MIAAALFVLQLAPALTPVAPTAPTKPQKVKQICKTFGTTGSRLGGQRICATAQEWDERERVDRENLNRMADNTVPTPH